MKKINQAEVIFKAFSDTLDKTMPTNEADYPDWFKARLDKCAKCKYNTKNIPTKYLPVGGLMLGKTLGKHRCSICTCFIQQKCWSRVEECAIGETDVRPDFLPKAYLDSREPNPEVSQWNRLEVLTMKADDFHLKSEDDGWYNVDLTPKGDAFVVTLPPLKQGEEKTYDMNFRLVAKEKMLIRKLGSSCGCTVPSLKSDDDVIYSLNVKFTPFTQFNIPPNSESNIQERDIKIHYIKEKDQDNPEANEDVVVMLFRCPVVRTPGYEAPKPKPRKPQPPKEEKKVEPGNQESHEGGQA